MNASHADNDPIRDALERAIGFQYEIVRLLGHGGMAAMALGEARASEIAGVRP